MYCSKCGNKLEEGQLFCPLCGTKYIDATQEVNNETLEVTDNAEKPSKVRTVFAAVGCGVGIWSLVFCWIFYLSIFTAIPALVFSILGFKSERHRGLAIAGLTCSIIALVLAGLLWIVFFKALDEISYDEDYIRNMYSLVKTNLL